MDGGCCIARYAGGGGGGAYDMSKVNRIMLKFRPIAPKPATTSSGSGGSSSQEFSDVSPRSGRGKRKCNGSNSNGNSTRRGGSGCGSRKRKALSEEKVETTVAVTLSLLPETPDRKEMITTPVKQSPVGFVTPKQAKNVPTWLSFGSGNYNDVKSCDQMVAFGGYGVSSDRAAAAAAAVMPQATRVVGSCVTVECVTDTWVDGDGLGCTDEERRVNLGRDTCPGFISDEFGRVTWTNEAYRDMVGVQQQGGDNMVVWLVMKEMVPVTVTLAGHRAFTCRVMVQHYDNNTCTGGMMISRGKEAVKSSITVPCDVWRMDCGGFAWRLDVKAALCLGR
ncbi:hypothetical protein Tsubulata_048767 [Turnera subulata]|uniref:DUF7950 domain-containing protein n=1 Tax=Turnera subulata TaxID=218843 RepID=A0A9Q0FVZ5_9ROSI|nr:hypothetical protein Tsubulata_048767 [Turnera subulata]